MQVKSMFSSRSIPVNSWRMPFLKAGSTAQVLHNTPGKKQNRAQSALSDSYSLTYAKREQGIIAGSKRPCRSQPAWIAGTERENALSRIAVATMHRRRRMAWSFVDPPHLPRPAPPQASTSPGQHLPRPLRPGVLIRWIPLPRPHQRRVDREPPVVSCAHTANH